MSHNVLILHGWGSSSQKWIQVKNNLESAGFNVFVPDLPGFGDAPSLLRPWSIDDYVEWLTDYCVKKKLFRFFLVGHSFGGAVASKFTANNPDKVIKLFLISAAIIRRKKPAGSFTARIAKLFSFLPQNVKRFFYSKILKSDYPLKKGALRETFKKIIENDLLKIIPKIHSPLIIIWGEEDKITPLKDAYLIKENNKNAVLEVLTKATHIPHIEFPDKLSEILIKYIE